VVACNMVGGARTLGACCQDHSFVPCWSGSWLDGLAI
jgi:hypothetical protein